MLPDVPGSLSRFPPPWLDVELGLRLCGFDDPQAFDQFVRPHPSDPAREALERGAIEIDQSALFREGVEARTSRKYEPPSAKAVVEATAVELGKLAALPSMFRLALGRIGPISSA